MTMPTPMAFSTQFLGNAVEPYLDHTFTVFLSNYKDNLNPQALRRFQKQSTPTSCHPVELWVRLKWIEVSTANWWRHNVHHFALFRSYNLCCHCECLRVPLCVCLCVCGGTLKTNNNNYLDNNFRYLLQVKPTGSRLQKYEICRISNIKTPLACQLNT